MDADYTGIKSICDKVEFENDGALFVINKNEEMVYEKNDLPESGLWEKLTLPTDNGDFSCRINGEKYIGNVTTLQESELKIIAPPLLSEPDQQGPGEFKPHSISCLYLHRSVYCYFYPVYTAFSSSSVSHHTHHGNSADRQSGRTGSVGTG